MGNDFLEKLRSQDNETKKKILVISAAIIMILVVIIWIKYFNNLVFSLSSSFNGEKDATAGFSFFDTMKAGVATVYDAFGGALRAIGEILGRPRDYIIEPNN